MSSTGKHSRARQAFIRCCVSADGEVLGGHGSMSQSAHSGASAGGKQRQEPLTTDMSMIISGNGPQLQAWVPRHACHAHRLSVLFLAAAQG